MLSDRLHAVVAFINRGFLIEGKPGKRPVGLALYCGLFAVNRQCG